MQAQAPSDHHLPPARAETVGSLLRPAGLKAARRRFALGEIGAAELRAEEDRAILDAIELQESLGFEVVTDGEMRRGMYADSFLQTALTGVRLSEQGSWSFRGGAPASAPRPVVEGRIAWTGASTNPADFAFLQSNTRATAKITLPGPCYIHFRGGREAIDRAAYPSLDAFWADLVEAYRREIEALSAAGCRYVQLDETSFAKFGDPEVRRGLADRGDDWRVLLDAYLEVIDAVVRAAPRGVLLAMHLCRGNNQGRWQAEGGYELVAAKLLARSAIPLFLLEFDSPRAGSLQILGHLAEGKAAVLGLISTKISALEDRDAVLARLAEAASFAPADRLAVSPQCGFASSEAGNPLTEAEQAAKLRLVADLAAAFWPQAS